MVQARIHARAMPLLRRVHMKIAKPRHDLMLSHKAMAATEKIICS